MPRNEVRDHNPIARGHVIGEGAALVSLHAVVDQPTGGHRVAGDIDRVCPPRRIGCRSKGDASCCPARRQLLIRRVLVQHRWSKELNRLHHPSRVRHTRIDVRVPRELVHREVRVDYVNNVVNHLNLNIADIGLPVVRGREVGPRVRRGHLVHLLKHPMRRVASGESRRVVQRPVVQVVGKPRHLNESPRRVAVAVRPVGHRGRVYRHLCRVVPSRTEADSHVAELQLERDTRRVLELAE